MSAIIRKKNYGKSEILKETIDILAKNSKIYLRNTCS